MQNALPTREAANGSVADGVFVSEEKWQFKRITGTLIQSPFFFFFLHMCMHSNAFSLSRMHAQMHALHSHWLYRQTYILTHIYLPLPSLANWAGGRWPSLLRGFPGCLINYPSAIVYREAEVERRLKMATVRWRDPFPCQCGGWGLGRERERQEIGAVKRPHRQREEQRGWDDIIDKVQFWLLPSYHFKY